VLVRGTLVTLQITNLTRHRRFTKNVTMAAPDLSSAEWVAESPAVCSTLGSCRGTRLANFGTVTFTRAAATGDGHTGTAGAVPTALSPSGRGFGIAWRASVSP
jgi:hypothetical protein